MVEIRITKEIGNYDPKFLGPFTLRQTICVVIAAPICYFIYNTFSPVMTPDAAGFFCAIPGAIAALFGWIRPYGMRTEKFIQSVFINMVIAPSHRKYKTVNEHEELLKKHDAEDWEAQLEAIPKTREGRKQRKALLRTQKKKYKRSSEAIK
jgi:hypothetical protein